MMKKTIFFKFCSVLYCLSVLFNSCMPLTVFALEEIPDEGDKGISIKNNVNTEVDKKEENDIMKVSLDAVYVSDENKGIGDCSDSDNACTIYDALNNVDVGGTIYLTESINVFSDVNIDKSVNVMSSPGIGCILSLNNNSSIVINDNAEVTLNDITIDGTNNINAKKAAITVTNGILNIYKNTTISKNISSGKAGGIYVGKDSTLNLKDVEIYKNENTGGENVTGGIIGTSTSNIKIYPNEGGAI